MARIPKPAPLVTRESLRDLLKNPNPKFVEAVVGKALAVLYSCQTDVEKQSGITVIHNEVGFTGADADIGTRCARYYIDKKRLLPWMVQVWIKVTSTGYPKICKYHRQLNDAAMKKQALKGANTHEGS